MDRVVHTAAQQTCMASEAASAFIRSQFHNKQQKIDVVFLCSGKEHVAENEVLWNLSEANYTFGKIYLIDVFDKEWKVEDEGGRESMMIDLVENTDPNNVICGSITLLMQHLLAQRTMTNIACVSIHPSFQTAVAFAEGPAYANVVNQLRDGLAEAAGLFFWFWCFLHKKSVAFCWRDGGQCVFADQNTDQVLSLSPYEVMKRTEQSLGSMQRCPKPKSVTDKCVPTTTSYGASG